MSDDPTFLLLVDNFFVIFHTALILFNLFGWIWKPLRKWHLAIISLTFASWVLLGYWYGWGYCPLTDWHWEILDKRGVGAVPNSYVSYLLQRLMGIRIPDVWVDYLTVSITLAAFTASLKVNFFLKGKKKNKD